MTIAMTFLFGMPGGGEWLLIFLAILLLFGGKKIPELMRGIGKGIREFNKAKEKVRESIHEGMTEDDENNPPQPLPKAPEQSVTFKKNS